MIKFWEAPEEQKKVIKQRIYQLSTELSSIKVASRIRDEYNVEISDRYIRNLLAYIKDEIDGVWETLTSAIEAVNEEEDKKQYSVEEIKWELHYILETKEEKFVIPVAQIDRMFKDFSRKGNNLSGEWMRQKYKLKPQAWNAIKTKLQLFKDSHVVSPYTLENLSEEDEWRVIEKAISDHIDTKVDKFTNTYEKKYKKLAEDAIKVKSNMDYYFEKLNEAVDKHIPLELDFEPYQEKEWDTIEHFILTDIHLGKIDTAWVIRRLDAMHNDIVNSKAQTVHITCLWDLVETLSDNGMHKWQLAYWTDASYGYGFDALMRTVVIFEKWLASIAKHGKKVYFRGITGNHWRFTQHKEDDHFRAWELVIYEMIKRWVSQLAVEVEYFKENIVVFIVDGIQFIMHHWDGNMSKQKPEQLIVAHAKFWVYTIILSWDKHNLKISEWKNYTQIQVPALAWQWLYDKDMNLHSEPAYAKIERNQYDTADITIKRLK